MSQPQLPLAHLEVEEVVRYLAGTLSPSDRERVELHLSDCADCTSELVAVGRLRQADRAPMRRLAAVAAAAAVVAGVALLGPALWHRGPSDASRVRGTDDQAGIRIVAPTDGAILRGPANFTWHAISGATTYRISVSRADGDTVCATTSRDTTAPASLDVSRAEPGLYYWYVDVLLGDGRSIGGTVHEFQIAP